MAASKGGDVVRWLYLAGVLAIVGCNAVEKSPKHSQAESVYRATKAIQGAIAVGVTNSRYSELLQNVSTELLILRDQASSKDDSILFGEYASALEIYRDSGRIWSAQISQAGKDYIPKGRVMLEDDLAIVALRYDLPTRDHLTYGVGWKSISSDDLQTLWARADRVVAKADSIYHLMRGVNSGN